MIVDHTREELAMEHHREQKASGGRGQRIPKQEANQMCMRLLLAEGRPYALSALWLLLQQEQCLEVVGDATRVGELLTQLQDVRPDVLLLDWALPDMRGCGLLPVLRVLYPDLRVVALSARPEMHREALEAGADAFVSKGEPPEHLLNALSVIRERLGDESGLDAFRECPSTCTM